MLTNVQIEDLAKKMGFPLEGVYFKNELPKKLKYNTGYVINLQNSEDEDGNENDGSHWTCLQVNKYPTGLIEPIFFDSYGQPPAESIKKFVKDNTGKYLPYTKKDIQSLMGNACGWYCCALLHYINASQYSTKDLYVDVSEFLDCFEDLDKSTNFKKNEFVLKHFFRSKNPKLRQEIDVIGDGVDRIKEGNGIRIPVEAKYA